MVFSNTVRILLTALLVVVNYLQLEVNFSHPIHIVIACVSLFLGAVGINVSSQESKSNEVKI
jgi:hypothetical protein